MLPVRSVRLQLGILLAADTTTLAPATANKIALVKAPFVPAEDLALGDLTLADFDGSTPIAGSTGAQPVAIDPATGDQIITIKDPLGAYRWVTSGITNLPQTIYGYALVDNAAAVLLATALLPVPVTLTAAGQQIDLGAVTMVLVQQPIS
jgi:hypothetical protein